MTSLFKFLSTEASYKGHKKLKKLSSFSLPLVDDYKLVLNNKKVKAKNKTKCH